MAFCPRMFISLWHFVRLSIFCVAFCQGGIWSVAFCAVALCPGFANSIQIADATRLYSTVESRQRRRCVLGITHTSGVITITVLFDGSFKEHCRRSGTTFIRSQWSERPQASGGVNAWIRLEDTLYISYNR